MDQQQQTCARECLEAAEANAMAFPAIVGKLIDAGFESYAIDYRRATATYYLPSGESIELTTASNGAAIGTSFDTDALQSAIREAQAEAQDYTYKGFCRKVKAAGCAGYIVSFLGRRAVYFGRTGETHVEMFPR